MIIHWLIDPFVSYGFMRRALVACCALSLSTTPLGVFLLLRRMSLVGDALSHAILPGVAVGYLLCGMSLMAMGIGGFIAGLLVAILSGLVTSQTALKEDASFAGFYLGSLALGVTLVSLHGSSVDLLHLLFGSILAVDINAISFVGIITTFTVLALALLYRALIIESFDVTFLRVNRRGYPKVIHALFLALVVLNLVAGFQILGTLMSVGLMMLPAVAARCWSGHLTTTLLLGVMIGLLSSLMGLLWSFYASLPAGPAIVLTASLCFFVSVLLGPRGGFMAALRRHRVVNSKEKE
ncbi:metal ABC transporter permease [Acerihabitans sp. TG2]|uniref:metal ABC transporter permease n=1 Tax=Acerihabitans sp. TG2 TaxID=3096008 RepID=UPI002B23DE0A|nr:metal ABC transporter permease [Acerihabitans sp. TG2]MEA9391878.1 metal ABC transporter permease [Acerihabitans sp. TG2]